MLRSTHRPPPLVLVALLGVLASVRPAACEVPDHCAAGIPAEEALGFVALPQGNVFCPLIADPKSNHSFFGYQREESDVLDVNLGVIGIADQFGLVRWGGPSPGEGLQIGLEGGVFAQFDMKSPSSDLINTDYLVGIPLTYRWSGFSTRLRFYHQSSHLGDEFLLREGLPVEREDLSFESIELLLSQDLGPLRVYAGGEFLPRSAPVELDPFLAHVGAELRTSHHLFTIGSLGAVHPIAAVDVKAVEQRDWNPAFSIRAGFEVSRPHIEESPGRTWALLFEAYDGLSPYGQFYRSDMKFYGVGIHFMQ